ncbi:MAG: FAD-binding oxidoreductase [Nitrososphaerota archaeon]|nr:FAD-binding oxidoreductase [Nitrososphaerota archaeon]
MADKSPGKRLLQRLKKILAADSILTDRESLDKYSTDMADFVGRPLLVLKPTNIQQVSSVIKLLNVLRIPVVPRGAGSSLTGASVSDGGVIIDTSRLNNIIKIDKVNWYAHVEAGVVIDTLNSELKKYGLFFPPDPASSFMCTVGGAVAEASGGLRCVKYGTVKDWVLALKVVLPDGDVAVFGEPLPKNRAGYDITHLFVGSEGTLGMIVEAWLKLIPVPYNPVSRMFVQFSTWEGANQAVMSLRRGMIQPNLLEFMDRDCIAAVNKELGLKIPEAEATLLIDVEKPLVAPTRDALKKAGYSGLRVARTEAEAEEMYQARAWTYVAIKKLGSGVMAEDVCVPLERLGEYVNYAKEVGKRNDVRIVVNGHAGDGNVHPTIVYDKNNRKSIQSAKLAFEEICDYAIKVGGTVTGEHGVGVQKTRMLRKQLQAHGGEAPLRLMKEIKKLFDKNDIMNPGKYVEAA